MVKELELSFSDKEITPWGGMAGCFKKIGFNDALRWVELPSQGSNREIFTISTIFSKRIV